MSLLFIEQSLKSYLLSKALVPAVETSVASLSLLPNLSRSVKIINTFNNLQLHYTHRQAS